ncbi:MAG: hypothetical protein HYV07_25140 [Deltaproteobacteria bacterium]|nr:hypothetical protein [Deltaproteobacteria bacterium]
MPPNELSELERLEQSELKSDVRLSNPTTVFEDAQQALAFVRYLEDAGIVARAVRVESEPNYWTVAAAPGLALADEILIRHYRAGALVADLPALPMSSRIGVLIEAVASHAIRADRWDVPLPTDLAWYGRLARLSESQVTQAVARARRDFFAQHARERHLAGWVAAFFAVAAALAFVARGGDWVTISLGGFAVVFLVFRLSRKRAP